jgi:hypothetical protein
MEYSTHSETGVLSASGESAETDLLEAPSLHARLREKIIRRADLRTVWFCHLFSFVECQRSGRYWTPAFDATQALGAVAVLIIV